jgi:hypothetical protein
VIFFLKHQHQHTTPMLLIAGVRSCMFVSSDYIQEPRRKERKWENMVGGGGGGACSLANKGATLCPFPFSSARIFFSFFGGTIVLRVFYFAGRLTVIIHRSSEACQAHTVYNQAHSVQLQQTFSSITMSTQTHQHNTYHKGVTAHMMKARNQIAVHSSVPFFLSKSTHINSSLVLFFSTHSH